MSTVFGRKRRRTKVKRLSSDAQVSYWRATTAPTIYYVFIIVNIIKLLNANLFYYMLQNLTLDSAHFTACSKVKNLSKYNFQNENIISNSNVEKCHKNECK